MNISWKQKRAALNRYAAKGLSGWQKVVASLENPIRVAVIYYSGFMVGALENPESYDPKLTITSKRFPNNGTGSIHDFQKFHSKVTDSILKEIKPYWLKFAEDVAVDGSLKDVDGFINKLLVSPQNVIWTRMYTNSMLHKKCEQANLIGQPYYDLLYSGPNNFWRGSEIRLGDLKELETFPGIVIVTETPLMKLHTDLQVVPETDKWFRLQAIVRWEITAPKTLHAIRLPEGEI